MTDADLITDLHSQLQSLTADLTRMQQAIDNIRENEATTLRRLSDILANSAAGQWDEVFHAAETAIAAKEAAEAAQTRLREALELAAGRIGHTPRCGHVRYGECDCDRETINERILAVLTPKEPSK